MVLSDFIFLLRGHLPVTKSSHFLPHTHPHRTGSEFLCSLPVIKSPFSPLSPLPPAVSFCSLSVIKSSLLLPLTPLPPAVNFCLFPPCNKVFTPFSTHPPPPPHPFPSTSNEFFRSLSVIKFSLLPPLTPLPPPFPFHQQWIFSLSLSNKVFTSPSSHPPPTGSEFFCSLPVMKFSLLPPFTLPPVTGSLVHQVFEHYLPPPPTGSENLRGPSRLPSLQTSPSAGVLTESPSLPRPQ